MTLLYPHHSVLAPARSFVRIGLVTGLSVVGLGCSAPRAESPITTTTATVDARGGGDSAHGVRIRAIQRHTRADGAGYASFYLVSVDLKNESEGPRKFRLTHLELLSAPCGERRWDSSQAIAVHGAVVWDQGSRL